VGPALPHLNHHLKARRGEEKSKIDIASRYSRRD
jgi:hypothetical protein